MSTLLTQLLTFLTSWNWYAIRAYRYQGVWDMSCLLSQFRKTVWGWSSLHTAEFMIIAIKVILSVCFYLNLWQNRIESPKLLSSFKLVFLLQATFSHPSVNPGVQSNLGFPGKGGVGGCHGTILFLTCPGFLFQAGSLYSRRFWRVHRQVLMGERSKTRLSASCVRRCSVVLQGKTRVIKERPWEQVFQVFFALDYRRRTSSVLSYFICQK